MPCGRFFRSGVTVSRAVNGEGRDRRVGGPSYAGGCSRVVPGPKVTSTVPMCLRTASERTELDDLAQLLTLGMQRVAACIWPVVVGTAGNLLAPPPPE